MPRVSDIERSALLDEKGRVLGSIEHVLFHPHEPRVVGLQIRPNRMLYVVDRRPYFVPLENVRFEDEGVFAAGKNPGSAKGEGFEWDVTVVWRGMPVRDEAGARLGAIHDLGFTKKTGRVTWLEMSEGAVSDAAVGRKRVAGEAARRFEPAEGVVVVDLEGTDAEGSGGLAKAAGTGAAYATVHGGKIAKAAGDKAIAAAVAAGKALKNGRARAAIDKARASAERWLDEGEDE